MAGRVYIVGAGPGDPELLTIRAFKILRKADVVIYDRLVGKDILACVKPSAMLFYAGKEDGYHSLTQNSINRLLFTYAEKGYTVVRLKGGDPFVFGRGGEEAFFLASKGVAFEVVPGITSAIGVPIYAGIPLTYRGVASSFAVVTGREAEFKKESSINFDSLAGIDTLVFLMAVSSRKEIATRLIRSGRDPLEPVAFVEEGTTERQRVVLSTLEDVATDPPEVRPPAIFVVGRVVMFRKKLEWFERKDYREERFYEEIGYSMEQP